MVADIVRANILLYPIKGVIFFFLCNQSFSLVNKSLVYYVFQLKEQQVDVR